MRPPPAPAVRLAGAALLALLATGGLVASAGSAVVGMPTVDALDTLLLRGLASGPELWRRGIYFPVGVPLHVLAPNLLDHLSAAPLVRLLPFPLADDLWWWAVLAANALAAHRLGRRAGGSEAAGWLAAVAWTWSEPLLREANLHHAPQALAPWAPLYLDALLCLRDAPTARRGALAGLWLGLSALTYWYAGLFLALGTLPLLPALPRRPLLALAGAAVAVAAPGLVPLLASGAPLAAQGPPVPADLPPALAALGPDRAFVALHGDDPLFWLRRTPADTSNRVSLALLVAAAVGGRGLPRRLRLGLWGTAIVGAAMLLGPVLLWRGEPVLVGDRAVPLPFGWLASLHPLLARLHWPERWGMLVPLGLLPLAARAPRPAIWALLVAAESWLASANLPLQRTDVRFQRCWAELARAPGAVLELPLRRGGLLVGRVGLHQRFHRRPLVNPVMLPPALSAPAAWRRWVEERPLLSAIRALEDGAWPDPPGEDAVRDLVGAGVSVIAADAEPGGPLTPGGLQRVRAGLTHLTGRAPVDLGCALAWWLDPSVPPPAPHPDPEGFRRAAAAWHRARPLPDVDALIHPAANRLRPAPAH